MTNVWICTMTLRMSVKLIETPHPPHKHGFAPALGRRRSHTHLCPAILDDDPSGGSRYSVSVMYSSSLPCVSLRVPVPPGTWM